MNEQTDNIKKQLDDIAVKINLGKGGNNNANWQRLFALIQSLPDDIVKTGA